MKKLIALVLALVMVLSLAACGGSSTPAATEAPAAADAPAAEETKEAKKVGVLLPTLQAEFFIVIGDTVEAELTSAGYDVNVVSYDMDAAKCIECIENFVAQGVDYITAMTMDSSSDDALKAAMDAGIVVIPCGVTTAYYDYLMLADNADAGSKIAEMAADWVNEKLDGKAQIGIIATHVNADMATRSDAMINTVKELLPESEVVMVGEVTGMVGEGTTFAENVLQSYPDCKVILSYGDVLAVEAVEAFKAAGKTDDTIGIFGNDATAQALDYIARGDLLRGTVFMGDIGLEMANAIKAWEAGELESGVTAIFPNVKITAENVADYS